MLYLGVSVVAAGLLGVGVLAASKGMVLGLLLPGIILSFLALLLTEIHGTRKEYVRTKKELHKEGAPKIMPSVDKFKNEAALCVDPTEVDELALQWLRDLCKEYGKDGKRAKELLDTVGELLDISP